MAFLTLNILIDAPGSALNLTEAKDNTMTVKSISGLGGARYPYVSAPAFRSWLRESIVRANPALRDTVSPIVASGSGQNQQAFTTCDPLTYWDDDLFGYMRAKKVKEGGRVTRQSPVRTSIFKSVDAVRINREFSTMARQMGEAENLENALIFNRENYATVLAGVLSINLGLVGTYTTLDKPGFMHISDDVEKQAVETCERVKYLHYDAYQMDIETRTERVISLLAGLANLQGGANQTLNYTDVSPVFIVGTVTSGGNNVYGRIFKVGDHSVVLNGDAVRQAQRVFGNDILSTYVGRVAGFMDNSQETLSALFNSNSNEHPREALEQMAIDLRSHPEWFASS